MVGKLTPDDRASASLLPAIMGLSKYQSPNDALLGCIRAIDGLGREDIGNEAMSWGNTFEPTILKEAAMRLGLDNLDISHDQPYHHASLPLSCSLDGTAFGRGLVIETDEEKGIYVVGQDSIILEGIGVLEAKLTASDTEDTPPLWRGPLQLQAQMDIMGSKWGAVCVLYRGVALRIYVFAPHPGSVAAITEAVTTFQKKLDDYRETKTIDYYPPIDSNDANRTWGSVTDDQNFMALGAEEDQLVDEILSAKETIKLAEARISKAEAQIKAMMQDRALAMTPRYDIKWPMRHYKAQPARIVPAKEASTVRQSTLSIKERKK